MPPASELMAPSRRRIFAVAWPIILANASVPLLGLTDTALIGNVGDVVDLAAIALGALLFNFLYWGFGFLRMSTTGFVAQADGAGDEVEIRATLGRALLLAALIGALILVLQAPLINIALQLLQASKGAEDLTRDYFSTRIWGAPASLGLFALMGCLIGLGRSGLLLRLQLLLNGSNILLDLLFAGFFDLGVQGIALGTAIAEWLSLGFGLIWVGGVLRQRSQDERIGIALQRLTDLVKLRRLLSANADILIRTLALLFAFAWFTQQGAGFGDRVLAANHLLLQFISFSAYFLDGFAFAAEALVGRALGGRRLDHFDATVRRSSELAAFTALLLCLALWAGGDLAIALLTDIGEVRAAAAQFLPYAVVYVLLSVAAFQLDGVFIGTSRTADMRNASLASLAVFLLAWWVLQDSANHGLWLAFILYVVARALALLAYYPGLRRSVAGESMAS